MSCCGGNKKAIKGKRTDGTIDGDRYFSTLMEGESSDPTLVVREYDLKTKSFKQATRRMTELNYRSYVRSLFLTEEHDYTYTGRVTSIFLMENEKYGFCKNLCIRTKNPTFKIDVSTGKPQIQKIEKPSQTKSTKEESSEKSAEKKGE